MLRPDTLRPARARFPASMLSAEATRRGRRSCATCSHTGGCSRRTAGGVGTLSVVSTCGTSRRLGRKFSASCGKAVPLKGVANVGPPGVVREPGVRDDGGAGAWRFQAVSGSAADAPGRGEEVPVAPAHLLLSHRDRRRSTLFLLRLEFVRLRPCQAHFLDQCSHAPVRSRPEEGGRSRSVGRLPRARPDRGRVLRSRSRRGWNMTEFVPELRALPAQQPRRRGAADTVGQYKRPDAASPSTARLGSP